MADKTLLDLSQLKTALSTFKNWIGSNFLKKDNSTAYTPTANYHPATKKYVDDGISNAAKVYTATTTVSANGTSVITNPLSVAISDSAQVYQNGLLLIKGVNYNINTDGNIALIGATADKDDTFTVVSKATGSDVTITSTAANVTLANTGGYFDNATSVETAINKIGETLANGVDTGEFAITITEVQNSSPSTTVIDKYTTCVSDSDRSTFHIDKTFNEIVTAYKSGKTLKLVIAGSALYDVLVDMNKAGDIIALHFTSVIAITLNNKYYCINNLISLKYDDNATDNIIITICQNQLSEMSKALSFVTSSSVSTFNIQSIVLNASDWDTATKTQTITLAGIVADETKQIIHVSPSTQSIDNMNLYYDSGIMAIGQSTNSLTFKANKIPTANITVLVSCAAQVTLNKEDNK